MKKTITTLAILFSLSAAAQEVISAPVLESQGKDRARTDAKALKGILDQSSAMTKTLKITEDGMEALKKVSNTISRSLQVNDIADNIIGCINGTSKLTQMIRTLEAKGADIEIIERLLKTVNKIIDRSNRLGSDLKTCVSDNKIKSDDAQRIMLLNEIEEKTGEMLQFINYQKMMVRIGLRIYD